MKLHDIPDTAFTPEMADAIANDAMWAEAERLVLRCATLAQQHGLTLPDTVALLVDQALTLVWHALFDAMKQVGFDEASAESAIVGAADIFPARAAVLARAAGMHPMGHA